MVNGKVMTQDEVAKLFHSVSLNVNNPHFLIMQGKITKVLNMKPPEVLAMIEEAAGTRLFEDRKDKAMKTILKRDVKLNEITNVRFISFSSFLLYIYSSFYLYSLQLMEAEIGPKLTSLREKRRDFVEYQKLENELGQLQRFLVAYDYYYSKVIFYCF